MYLYVIFGALIQVEMWICVVEWIDDKCWLTWILWCCSWDLEWWCGICVWMYLWYMLVGRLNCLGISNWVELCGDDYIVILWNGWWYLIDCWSPLYNCLPNGDQYGCGGNKWDVNVTPKTYPCRGHWMSCVIHPLLCVIIKQGSLEKNVWKRRW